MKNILVLSGVLTLSLTQGFSALGFNPSQQEKIVAELGYVIPSPLSPPSNLSPLSIPEISPLRVNPPVGGSELKTNYTDEQIKTVSPDPEVAPPPWRTIVPLGGRFESQANDSQGYQSSQWVYIAGDQDNEVFLDYNRVRKNRSIYSAPIVIKRNSFSLDALAEVDCKDYYYRIVTFASGTTWSPVKLGYVPEGIANLLCKRKRAR